MAPTGIFHREDTHRVEAEGVTDDWAAPEQLILHWQWGEGGSYRGPAIILGPIGILIY